MELKPICTKVEHEAALAWVEAQFDADVLRYSSAGKKVQQMLLLIKRYEDTCYPVLPPAPQ